MTLSKADIDAALESAEPATKSVPVPELGGSVEVRELSGSLRNAFEAAIASVGAADGEKKLNAVTIRIVSESTLDGEGNILLDPDRTRQLFRKKPRAVFRLSAHLGLPVAEMLARVSSSELTEWQAYEQVYGPLGQVRDDIHTALLLAMVHNQWAKHPKKPDAFMPEWGPRRPVSEKLRSWVAQFGGSDGDAS